MDDIAISSAGASTAFPPLQVIRRNGTVVPFDSEKISIAMRKAFLAVSGDKGNASGRLRDQALALTQTVAAALARRLPAGGSVHIEDIQDQVELALMRAGEHDVARAYVLYREKRAAERASKPSDALQIHVVIDGSRTPLDPALLHDMVAEACLELGDEVDPDLVVKQAVRDLYDGIPFNELR